MSTPFVDTKSEADFLKRLLPFVRAIRKGRDLELARPAFEYEQRFSQRLEELEAEPQAVSFATREGDADPEAD